MDLAEAALWLEASWLGQWMRHGWSYAVANVVHLFGMALLVGAILLLDLRLLGMGRRLDPGEVSRTLTPFALAGLLLAIGSGVLMFAADAVAMARHPLIPWKLGLIGLGLANALAFHRMVGRKVHDWAGTPPVGARASALVSLLIWLTVPVLGRLIAYI